MTAQELAQTHLAAFGADKAWSEAQFSTYLSDPAVLLTGDSASFVLGRITVDEAEILTLATAPERQRQGLARQALRQFADRAAAAGAVSIFLEVAQSNEPASHLYAAEGFRPVGERKDYYRQKGAAPVTALILKHDLP